MSEWFKEHAWKVCILQKGIAGSNPALSADLTSNESNKFKKVTLNLNKIDNLNKSKSSNQHFQL